MGPKHNAIQYSDDWENKCSYLHFNIIFQVNFHLEIFLATYNSYSYIYFLKVIKDFKAKRHEDVEYCVQHVFEQSFDHVNNLVALENHVQNMIRLNLVFSLCKMLYAQITFECSLKWHLNDFHIGALSCKVRNPLLTVEYR